MQPTVARAMRPAPILRFKPTLARSVHPDWRDPWERRDSWRYQAPFKSAPGIFNYTVTFWPCVGIFMTWVAFDEIVNHGPLKKYVWGEDKPHAAGHHGDSSHSSSHDSQSSFVPDAVERMKDTMHDVEHNVEDKLARARQYADSLKH